MGLFLQTMCFVIGQVGNQDQSVNRRPDHQASSGGTNGSIKAING